MNWEQRLTVIWKRIDGATALRVQAKINSGPGDPSDKPLSGASRLALFFAAGATIVLTYILAAFSLITLFVAVGLELLLALVLAELGLKGFAANVIGSHVALPGILLRSFLLHEAAEYRIKLAPADAPKLFELVRQLCQKAEVAMPYEISVEMEPTAWVILRGYRRGAGRTVLGIGLDLLAGLSQWEMEGVLAHEITHAKVVQRGYRRWINRGLGRMRQLARGLHDQVEERTRLQTFTEPAETLYRMADKLTRLAARLVAACSRQDEFDADRGAAALCGAGAIRSSLLKLGSLQERSVRLPWNERVGKLQLGQGFGRWLVEELCWADSDQAEPRESPFDKYSSHPSLSDRLAALPASETEPKRNLSSAMDLLAAPDQVAEALISKIEATTAKEELKDTRRLRKWTRQGGLHRQLGTTQFLGILLILVALLFGSGLLVVRAKSLREAGIFFGMIGMGILCFRLGRYRERLALGIPDFGVLKYVWRTRIHVTPEQVKALELEIQFQHDARLSKPKRALALAETAYEALHRCDYLEAHVAARLCLQLNDKSVEGLVGLAVAAAGLGDIQQVHRALGFLHQVPARSAPAVTWGVAWALVLCEDWGQAEAFLEKRCQQKPAHPTLFLLLASCQSKRGKLQSALLLARKVCEAEPAKVEHSKFLIQLLLKAGYLREARERLQKLEPLIDRDFELIMMSVQLALLSRDFDAANLWTQRLRQKKARPQLYLQLGLLYETARQDEKAFGFYHEVLSAGFYPEALMGLARLEAQAQDKEAARRHLAAALNINRPLGELAVGPLPLLNQILALLLALDEPITGCGAWTAHLNGGKAPPGLENGSILIYARSFQQAQEMLQALFAKMQPGTPPIPNSSIGWTQVDKDKQPDGPVRAGVQAVLG